ncbi:uncharacterized protein B0H18DRAFT_956806 [Fomitopsis serialis]|uniref:uncharacterized protein n=1 Tax=Fomitopsis serialis TaxID=139415 RepID=UPI002008060B|nr:uncharacterized protein B0H18DRAFT_956806 [Neoantrodia serialis]KAH9921056.1 hypothetical protein B0H18DRAFT_956806 [Neoantrodia serialis]
MYPSCAKGIRELLQLVASSYPPADTEDGKHAKQQLVTPYSFYCGLLNITPGSCKSAQQFQLSALYDYGDGGDGAQHQLGKTQGWDCQDLYNELETGPKSTILKAQLQDAFFNLVALKSTGQHSPKYNLLKGVPAHLVTIPEIQTNAVVQCSVIDMRAMKCFSSSPNKETGKHIM